MEPARRFVYLQNIINCKLLIYLQLVCRVFKLTTPAVHVAICKCCRTWYQWPHGHSRGHWNSTGLHSVFYSHCSALFPHKDWPLLTIITYWQKDQLATPSLAVPIQEFRRTVFVLVVNFLLALKWILGVALATSSVEALLPSHADMENGMLWNGMASGHNV